jgi:predicted alpha/beta-hydrolase family hydrolase
VVRLDIGVIVEKNQVATNIFSAMKDPLLINIKEFHVNSPVEAPKGLFLLAHGATYGMATPFMETIAKGVINAGVRVVRFHFPYMEDMLRSGIHKSPDGGKILRQSFSDVITHCVEHEGVPYKNIVIGGKAMGGRVASMIADEHQVAGVICLGYPFHPPRKPKRVRFEHLKTIQTPTLICQGERDAKGLLEEIQQLELSNSVQLHWLEGGDNDFEPPKNSARTHEQNMREAVQASNDFITRILRISK